MNWSPDLLLADHLPTGKNCIAFPAVLHSNKNDDLHSLPGAFHEALLAHHMRNRGTKHWMGLEGNSDWKRTAELETGALEGLAELEGNVDWKKTAALSNSGGLEGAKENLRSLSMEQYLLEDSFC